MKYLKTFEEVGITNRSSTSINDKEFIRSMEDSIEAIFIDMIDEGFNLDMTLTDYGGNCGWIKLSKWRGDKKIEEYLDTFHQFYDYIIEKGYDIKDINLGGWISDERDRAISFSYKNWDFVKEHLIKAAKDRNFTGLSLYLSPIKTKWVKELHRYEPLYKIKS